MGDQTVPPTPVSLTGIHEAIAALDPTRSFEKISYNLTSHNSLAQNWWVFIPYGRWASPPKPPTPSPLESAILWAFQDADVSKRCSIDILGLGNAQREFFNDKGNSIVDALVRLIKQVPGGTIPVIRYLVGSNAALHPPDDGFLQALFSISGERPNGQIFYGNFSPVYAASNISAGGTEQHLDLVIGSIWHLLNDEIKKLSAPMHRELANIEAPIVPWVKQFAKLLIPTVSWNHAKIVAINGSRLVTGGANYWSDYVTGKEKIFDLSMRIDGDAATDAHLFADYLWTYLRNIPANDISSFSLGNQLTNPIGKFSAAKAPLFTGFPRNSGSTPALTVGRNGNWPSQHGFPVQVVDAIRDFIINILAVFAEARLGQRADEFTAFAVRELSDDNPQLRAALKVVGVNPAAWATRYARNYAVSRAQTSLRFSQQKFVMDDLAESGDSPLYRELVADINRYLKTKWKGYLWPFDTLSAFGYALANISANAPREGGIEIVCSTSAPYDKTAGYNDPVTAREFTKRLTGIMTGMKSLGYIHPADGVPDIVKRWIAYKRVDILNDSPKHYNHAKLTIVDDTVCYVGSDNAYPSYNEEFGVWINEPSAIQSFISQYWNGLWNFAKTDPMQDDARARRT